MGFRLRNDVVIQEKGNHSIWWPIFPIEIEEIESLMKG